jgi:uncharacterized protein (TIGR02246 family)
MTSRDEQAIRNVIDQWMRASEAGDVNTVLSLMTDDVVFMTVGREPFGKEAFAESSRKMQGVKMKAVSDPVEIKVLGDWACVRNHIKVTMTPPGGEASTRSGYTLTIFTKGPDGAWKLSRDANLLS